MIKRAIEKRSKDEYYRNTGKDIKIVLPKITAPNLNLQKINFFNQKQSFLAFVGFDLKLEMQHKINQIDSQIQIDCIERY